MKFVLKPINFLYFCLFFFTPLIFTNQNSELFELPKMYFVYGLTALILLFHLVNFFHQKVLLFQKNFLNLFFLLFLISQTISTFFSIDPHTSFYGYYSRLNGGLLSLLCYFVLFQILQVYLDKKFLQQIINTSLLSGFVVSLYAIAQHFGIDNNKWVQDVQSRVFSTLGQPNWLAAYLGILLPLGLYKNISEYNKKYINTLILALINISFYISILFTKSKSGIIAAVVSLAFFFVFYLLKNQNKNTLKLIIPLFTIFVLSSLILKNPISDQLNFHSSTPATTPSTATSSAVLNITASEDIRKIVWAGAIALWKQYPIFGTGTETFAYTYYWTRPISHNLTSEWDFLYNKAHNEYLNYLANTGAVGLISYLAFIIAAFVSIYRSSSSYLLKVTLFASLINLLITNSVGFSVVITSLYLFLLPVLSRPQDIFALSPKQKSVSSSLLSFASIVLCLFFLQKIIFFYAADIAYNQSVTADTKSDAKSAYSYITSALNLNKSEPTYMIKMGTIAAEIAASANIAKNTQLTDQFLNQSILYTEAAIRISPANTNFWKERAQIYYYLSTIDTKYFPESISSLLKVSSLAPTDAKTYFLTGQFLEVAQDYTDAAVYYQKAIDVKSNYDHAYYALGVIQFNDKKYDLAKANFENALKYAPTNTDAQNYLTKIEVNK